MYSYSCKAWCERAFTLMSLHTCMYFSFNRRYFKECAGNYFPCIYKTQKRFSDYKHTQRHHESIIIIISPYDLCTILLSSETTFCKKKHKKNPPKFKQLWHFYGTFASFLKPETFSSHSFKLHDQLVLHSSKCCSSSEGKSYEFGIT